MILNEAVELELARPKSWGFTKANTGTDAFWMEFELPNCKGDNDEEVKVKHWFYLTDANIDYVLRDLATLGWTGKNIIELDPAEPNSFSFFGHEVLLTVYMEQYNGKSYPKVKFINPLGYTPGTKLLEKNEIKSLSEKMRGKIAAFRSKNGNGNNVVKKPEPVFADHADKNIPF